MTIVDHTDVHDLTVQGSQGARAWALRHLTETAGLPTISNWMIDARITYLLGVVFDGTPAEQRQTINTWAAYLHVPVEEGTAAGLVTVSAEGPCEYGVRVRVYAQFPAVTEEANA